MLVQWGDRLFYPVNRIVKSSAVPRLSEPSLRGRADEIRARLESTLVRRAPQVVIKVTGGGRGMRAIAAHFRYISRNGRLVMEDELGERLQGRAGLPGLVEEWRLGGTPIGEVGYRREALNIMLSMPKGADAGSVLLAARAFAREEFAHCKYVMVLHEHQANPHVHLSVRAEAGNGKRLNPLKADLQRWRAKFAEELRGPGIGAEASPRRWRGAARRDEELWRIKPKEAGRLRRHAPRIVTRRPESLKAVHALTQLVRVLARSESKRDQALAKMIVGRMHDHRPTRQERAGSREQIARDFGR